MAKRKTEEYIFADAYICTFVRDLMTRQDMARLASSKNLEDAGTVLAEFGYGDVKSLNGGNIDGFINGERQKLKDLVFDTIPDREELAYYLFPYDYHNAKVCLKSEFLGLAPPEGILVSSGNLEYKRMISMIRDRNYAFMPANMRDAVIEAADLFGRGGDPQETDIILDKACYRDMLEAAEKTNEDFLVGLMRLQIDTINLKTFVRLREMGKPWTFFRKVFLEGGDIPAQFFISSYEDSYDLVAEKLSPYALRDVMAEGGLKFRETGDFSLLEKLAEDAVMKFNRDVKYVSFGITPIAGYWYGKETEINNLRLILTEIAIGSAPEQIEERVREPYV